jgi:hypothetical protein
MEASAVRVSLSESGADEEHLDTLTRQLRDELRQLDVRDVALAPADTEPPPGTRGLDVVAVGQLLVGLIGPEGLAAVLVTVRGWLGRGQSARRTVRVEIDGDVLELSGASDEDQERLVKMFLSRHAAEA